MSTITDLGANIPAAINASGQVAGTTTNYDNHAFLYSDGTLTDLGSVGDFEDSDAAALNDQGKVVGFLASSSSSNVVHAMLYNGQTMTDRGTAPGYTDGYATGINDANQAVGYADTGPGTAPHAFLYSHGTFTDLTGAAGGYANALNASGQVVGQTGGNYHAFLYTAGQLTDLGTLGGQGSNAYGINASGQVVGVAAMSGGVSQPFLWTPDAPNGTTGHMTGLGVLPDGSQTGTGFGVNSAGQVVGTDYGHQGNPLDAFLYENGTLMNLNDFLPAGSGWHLTHALAINDAGQVVGYGYLNGLLHGFLLNLNDEPAAQDGGSVLATEALAAAVARVPQAVPAGQSLAAAPVEQLLPQPVPAATGDGETAVSPVAALTDPGPAVSAVRTSAAADVGPLTPDLLDGP